MPEVLLASRTVGAKLHGQKGNSPDLHLRSLSFRNFYGLSAYFLCTLELSVIKEVEFL